MELYFYLFEMLTLGFLIGYCVGKMTRVRRCAGTLREDRSDPDEEPYLFLELTQEGFHKIQTNDYVTLKVLRENYIPRK